MLLAIPLPVLASGEFKSISEIGRRNSASYEDWKIREIRILNLHDKSDVGGTFLRNVKIMEAPENNGFFVARSAYLNMRNGSLMFWEKTFLSRPRAVVIGNGGQYVEVSESPFNSAEHCGPVTRITRFDLEGDVTSYGATPPLATSSDNRTFLPFRLSQSLSGNPKRSSEGGDHNGYGESEKAAVNIKEAERAARLADYEGEAVIFFLTFGFIVCAFPAYALLIMGYEKIFGGKKQC